MSFDLKIEYDFMSAHYIKEQQDLLQSFGSKGYLRATIQQPQEQQLLRNLFSDPLLWLNEAHEYNFVGNYKRVADLCLDYLEGTETPLDEDISQMNEWVNQIKKDAQIELQKGFKGITRGNYALKVLFVYHIQEFFKLGLKLQSEGLNPSIRIDF